MVIEAELLEAINKDLPNQVGTQLKTRLEQAEKDAAAVKNLTKRLDEMSAEMQAISSSRDLALAEMERLKTLLIAQDVTEKRARGFDLEVARLKQENAERGQQMLFDVLKIAFKSPVYVQAYSENGTMPTSIPQGGYVNQTQYNVE